MSLPTRLYMVHDRTEHEYDEYDQRAECAEPQGWREHSLELWGEHKPFFFPSAQRVYRSHSAARERAGLINQWGGNAVVVECTPEWMHVEDANAQRRRRRIHERIMKLEDALAGQRAKFAAAGPEGGQALIDERAGVNT